MHRFLPTLVLVLAITAIFILLYPTLSQTGLLIDALTARTR